MTVRYTSGWGHINARFTPSGKLHAFRVRTDHDPVLFEAVPVCGSRASGPYAPVVPFNFTHPLACRSCVKIARSEIEAAAELDAFIATVHQALRDMPETLE